MSGNRIPDFTDSERWVVAGALKERYGHDVATQDVETEIRLLPDDRELTTCPGLYWEDETGCHFIVSKTGEARYRCMFFYRVLRRYGTGKEEYDNLGDCIVSLLRVQADHASTGEGRDAPY